MYLDNTYFNCYPDLALYSVYDQNTNNTILYTLKSGQTDPYSGNQTKIHLGYIQSTPYNTTALNGSYFHGLVAIREYYSEKEKDYLYLSDDDKVNQMGNISGNYVFKRIIGYTFQSYRVSPNYYNYFIVSVDNNWDNSFNQYGKGLLELFLKVKVMDEFGNDTGKTLNVNSTPIIEKDGRTDIYSIPTYDIMEVDLYINYYPSINNTQRILLGKNFYFSNNYPHPSTFSYTQSVGKYQVKAELKRVAVNMWNIHLSKVN